MMISDAKTVEQYLAEMSDDSLWLLRIYENPKINAELQRRHKLWQKRQDELLQDTDE
jgi:hypothetical protein